MKTVSNINQKLQFLFHHVLELYIELELTILWKKLVLLKITHICETLNLSNIV